MKPTALPPDHTEAEGAITVIDPDIKAAIVKEDPAFEELMADRRKLLRKVDAWVPVDSPDDSPRMEEAKRMRLSLVKNRTSLDRLRKAVGEKAHKVWKATNETFAPLLKENSEAEDFLEESEKFAQRYEESRKAELAQERTAKLIPFLLDPAEAATLNLGSITEETFGHILSGAKSVQAARVAKALEEEQHRQADRQRAEKAELSMRRWREMSQYADPAAYNFDVSEQEYQDALKLAKVAYDLEVVAERERQKVADAEAAALAEERRVQREEQEALAEAARQEKARADALEAEKVKQQEAERKKVEDEKKAAAKAARAPDKEKLAQWGKDIAEVILEGYPKVKSTDALTAIETVWDDARLLLEKLRKLTEAL